MLGKRDRVHSLGHRDLSGWEQFCKDTASDTASRFIEQVRRYKDRDTTAAVVSESQFAEKFTTFFIEEMLTRSGCTATSNVGGDSSNYAMTKLPHCYKPSRGGGKAWWNIFKWSKSSKGEAGLSGSRKITPSSAEGRKVLEGVVNLLDMNDPQQCLSWQQCKLVMLSVQGNYQLEVFCPPKNPTPKMSLFCFLIEDVRPTTSLEIPDSNSSFVIKSHNHGEYVFDAGTTDSQLQWIRIIQQYSGARTSTHAGNGHLPTLSNGHSSPPPFTNSHNSANGGPPRTPQGKPPSLEVEMECLSESPLVIRQRQQQCNNGNNVQNALDRDDGEDSDLFSFVRNSPHRSPRRHAHSMFIESPSQLHPPRSPPSQSPPSQSPPPLPQRKSTRPRSVSCSNQPSDDTTGGDGSERNRSTESPTSTLHDDVNASSLGTGSASSSSSALHPVSLAAIQQRSQKAAAMVHSRKTSSPVSPLNPDTPRGKSASADNLSAKMGPSLLEPKEDRSQGHIRSVSDVGRSAPAPTSAEQPSIERYVPTPENESTEVQRVEVILTPDTSRSNSTSDAEQQSINPIYVETTESQGYNQSVTHTHHPYASWATSHQDARNLRNLSQFPWFHGMISRANASQLVLADGEGCYFVRQSESREGDFVLTFNYHNRAKHLRMTVDDTGCNIQHLWFNDVPSMLEYFKTNSIPLESFWLNEDVKLSTYIDRAASDAFRTTTVLNVDRLHRTPPRRSRSLHLGRSRAVGNPSTPSPTEQRSVSQGSSSNSLPQVVRGNTGWRQLFRSQRSSSAGNVGRVQRRHSTNAGSILAARRPIQQDNNYVYRY